VLAVVRPLAIVPIGVDALRPLPDAPDWTNTVSVGFQSM